MSNEKILIVEDNQTNLKLFNVLLTIEGYQVQTAKDGYEALDILNIYKPNLILMDIQLPGMDGLELTRKLKTDPKYKDLPIVAITAYAMKGDKEKALASGCAGYITKPIDPKNFLQIIAEFLHPTEM